MSTKQDKVLLKLRRLYSKDESFAYIDSLLRSCKEEIGVLKSEVSELEFNLSNSNKKLLNAERELSILKNNYSKLQSMMEGDERVKKLKDQLKELKKKNRKYVEQIVQLNKNNNI